MIYTIEKSGQKIDVEATYLMYFNEMWTADRLREHYDYDMSIDEANMIIDLGRKLNHKRGK